MRWNSHLAATVCLAITSVVAVPSTHAVHEERHTAPERWVKRDRVRPNSIFPVRIGLAQSNLHRGHDHLMSVSDPESPNYGKHWTSAEVIEAFKPSDHTVDTVRGWLTNAGIPESSIVHSDNKGWLAFDTTAAQMEELLHTQYHEYEDAVSGAILPSCDRYHLPKHIQKHVDYITPGLKLLAPNEPIRQIQRKRAVPRALGKPSSKSWKAEWDALLTTDAAKLANCDQVITPQCIAALYKIPPSGCEPNATNKMGVYESSLQVWNQPDLNAFFTWLTKIPNGTHPVNKAIDGGKSYSSVVQDAGGEIMLDLDLIFPIVYPQTVVIWDENDLHYQGWVNATSSFGFNQLLDSIDGSYCTYSAYGETGDAKGIDPSYPDKTPQTGYNHPLQCGVYKPMNVLSTSYGGQEIDVPIAYQKRQCNEFMKLGLQGVSFLFASGDTGVGQYPTQYGGFDGPTGCLGPKQNVFNPTWPNTCPYITAVGATKVYPGNNVNESQPESVVFDPDPQDIYLNYSSGGGFSNVYPIPDYQKSAVAAYLKNHNPPYPYYSKLAPEVPNPAVVNISQLQGKTGGLYNRIGRAYPDVTANGDNIAVVAGGERQLSGGTSASTPIFSSIINRINEERLAAGKGPVGFLNPVFYKNPGVLNDVTNGTNPGCQTPGFKAAPGWDPASGLGTPNYPKMLQLFMSLP